jgi:hypothetical protein
MPGGVVVPIADRQRQNIARRLPMLSLDELDENRLHPAWAEELFGRPWEATDAG